MSQVLDYSAGFPGAQNIKNKGYIGAVRYAGRPGNPKNATRSELLDFDGQHIGMAMIYEGAATDWRGGFNAGRDNARATRDHTNSMGFPADRPIYMAIDQDVVRSGEFATMVEYLRGANLSLGGPGRTGVYGEADVIDRARDAGVASYFWQTAAWSGGRRTFAHLFQRIGTVSVGGVACDISDVLQEDWGQHNYEGDLVTTQAEFNELLNKGLESITGGDNVGKRNLRDAMFQGAAWAAEGITTTRSARDAVLAHIDLRSVGFTEEQVTLLGSQLATDLGATLGSSVATAVLAEASRRLAGE